MDAGTVPKDFDWSEDFLIARAWTFTVDDAPSGVPSYSVEVAKRGEIGFTEDETDTLSLSLGS